MSLNLIVTIDIEEEGLFTGNYDPSAASVRNVTALEKLDQLFRKWSVRPTLLVAYPVIADPDCVRFLKGIAKDWDAEVGAHLHYWNTPPLVELPYEDPIPSEMIPKDILHAKLVSLVEGLEAAGFQPESFRMGRFSFGANVLSLLPSVGIKVDSSVAPLRRSRGGPDHLLAPNEPYYPDETNVCSKGSSKILEVPITVVPLFPYFEGPILRLPNPVSGWLAEKLLSIPIQPMWSDLSRLRAGTELFLRRGGQVLTMFFHSSELMPGGNPKHSTESDVRAFVNRLDLFFEWLFNRTEVKSATLTEIRSLFEQNSPSA